MNHRTYLNILWSALLIRYASIYIPLALLALFSQRGSLLLPFTLAFWIISGILIVVEKMSSYVKIEQSRVVWRYFWFKSYLPVGAVISIRKSRSKGIIGQPKSVEINFSKEDGSVGERHVLLHQFGLNDIQEFVSDLLKLNPKIRAEGNFGG